MHRRSPRDLPPARSRIAARLPVSTLSFALRFTPLILLLLTSCAAVPKPRLVLLVVIDTIRADHLGCYGYADIATPNLDLLAAEGAVYDQAMTAVPLTLPSVSTMLTGAYPLQHGIRDNGPFRLADGWDTLAERFRDAGFETGAFLSAHVLARTHGLDQGFDVYDDDFSVRYETHHPLMLQMEDRLQGIERRAEKTVDRVLSWMDRTPRCDAFALVHFFDPHLPRDPVPEFRDAYPRRLYDGEIATVDREIGRLLARARDIWGEEQILTVVVGDHGEGLLDHEEEYHGVLLFEETMRVPLIVHGPGVPGGIRVQEVARTIDLAPTLCALTGLAPLARASGAVLPGIDAGQARDATEGASEDAGEYDDVAYLETLRPRLSHGWCELRGLRTERWKLIEGPEVELYDLASDPDERVNVAEEEPAVRDSLLALLDAAGWRSLRAGREAPVMAGDSAEERARLLSLGYISPSELPAAVADSAAIWGFPADRRGIVLGMTNPRDRLLAYNNRTTARSYATSAHASLRDGELGLAEQTFRAALHYDEKSVEANLGLSEVLVRTGRRLEALELLDRVIQRGTAPAEIVRRRAEISGGKGAHG